MTFRQVYHVLAIGLLTCLATSAAQAQGATAMVEDISSDRQDIQIMDYLTSGQVIELSEAETLTIGYFASCVVETVTGGVVTIGERKSAVAGGALDTEYVDCDNQVLVLASGQQQEAGTTAVRAGKPCRNLVPDLVVYDVSPLVQLTESAETIEFVGCDDAASSDWHVLETESGRVDFRLAEIELQVGQKYLMRRGEVTTLVLISRNAAQNTTALIGRLVPL